MSKLMSIKVKVIHNRRHLSLSTWPQFNERPVAQKYGRPWASTPQKQSKFSPEIYKARKGTRCLRYR